MSTGDRLRRPPALRVGRYLVLDRLAAGGTATVHLGRSISGSGFSRTVAIKRLLPHLSSDVSVAGMLHDEARVLSRVHHPNLVVPLDVVAEEGETLLVMEYVHGLSLAELAGCLRRDGETLRPELCSAIFCGILAGLDAAHEARDEQGRLLGVVHRDISPQNILIGVDGLPRLVDFGIAKLAGRVQTTREGEVKGKLAYMAPEQLSAGFVDRRSDLYSVGVCLWEALVGRPLFADASGQPSITRIVNAEVEPPSRYVLGLPAALDDVLASALEREAQRRVPTARELALRLERAVAPAPASAVAELVRSHGADLLAQRQEVVAAAERASSQALDPRAPRAHGLTRYATLLGLLALAGLVTFAFAAPRAERNIELGAPSTSGPPRPPPSPVPASRAAPVASSAPSAPPASAPAASSPPTKTRSTPARGTQAPTAKATACDPPHYRDAQGVKHYKLECM